jgi:hypothetical protein
MGEAAGKSKRRPSWSRKLCCQAEFEFFDDTGFELYPLIRYKLALLVFSILILLVSICPLRAVEEWSA